MARTTQLVIMGQHRKQEMDVDVAEVDGNFYAIFSVLQVHIQHAWQLCYCFI